MSACNNQPMQRPLTSGQARDRRVSAERWWAPAAEPSVVRLQCPGVKEVAG
jgi:hypothetical protein